MKREISDAEAICRSVDDPAAFRVVFDRHFSDVHRYLRHRAGPEVADDLAAETFVRAFASRQGFRPQTADARAWLFAIATNLLRDNARHGVRAASALARLAAQSAPHVAAIAEAPDPDLAAALAVLRDEEREALLLFAWAELSYEEIAAVTGARVGTVRSRLSRARARLRSALEPCGATPAVAPLVQMEGACDD